MHCSIPRTVQAECSKFCFISESEMFCCLSTVIYALLYSLIVSVSTHTTQPEFCLNSCLTWFEIFSLLCHYQASLLARVFNYVKLLSPTSSTCIGCLSPNYTVSEGWVRPELHLPQTGDRVLSTVFRKLSRWSMLML